MQDYKKLEIWDFSKNLCVDLYKLTLRFPSQEKFGLVSQLQRASVSVPTNIAEGAGRSTNKDFANFLSISIGSINEICTLLVISEELNFIEKDDSSKLANEYEHLKRMMINFRKLLH